MLNQFLFTAEFSDGTVYHQNSQDKSIYGLVNCFSDIQAHGKKIVKFVMVGCGHVYILDLVWGSLDIDGQKIWPPVEIYPGMPIKLIYQRVSQQSITNTMEVQKRNGILGLVGIESKQKSNCVGYLIGYEFPRNGKNVQWTMKIKVEDN